MIGFLLGMFIPVAGHNFHWFEEHFPEDLLYFMAIAAVVGGLASFSQLPFIFSEAGRANLAERGLFEFTIAYGVGLKLYMVPLTTYFTVRKLAERLLSRKSKAEAI